MPQAFSRIIACEPKVLAEGDHPQDGGGIFVTTAANLVGGSSLTTVMESLCDLSVSFVYNYQFWIF